MKKRKSIPKQTSAATSSAGNTAAQRQLTYVLQEANESELSPKLIEAGIAADSILVVKNPASNLDNYENQQFCPVYLHNIDFIEKANSASNSQSDCIGIAGDKNALNSFSLRLFQDVELAAEPIGLNLLTKESMQKYLLQPVPASALEDGILAYKSSSEPKTFVLEGSNNANIAALATSLKLLAVKQYFVGGFSQPLKQLKADGLKGAGHGNHPIYKLALNCFMVFSFLLMPFLSFDYGITWDEPVLAEYASDIHTYYTSMGEDTIVFDLAKRHARNATIHYGASFDYAAHLFDTYLSPFDGIYESRHFLNAITGVLSIVFTARIALLLGTWRTALIAALLMFFSPRFFGHAMNNPKDVPFVMGMAMCIYYSLRFALTMKKPSYSTIMWLVISIAIPISIKIGGLLAVGFLGVIVGGAWLGEIKSDGLNNAFKLIPKLLIYLLPIVLAGYLLGILFWPWGIRAPFTNPLISLTEFTNFRFLITYELFDGQRINMDNPPWYYIPKWIYISAPVFVLLGLLIGLIPLPQRVKGQKWPIILAMLFTMVFPVAYTVAKNSTLYSGWRHLMFIYPPLVVLAAGGWDSLIELFKAKAVKFAVAGLLAAGIINTGIWMARNHPNQAVYFNEIIGGIQGAYGQYETEYWCNAMKQATEWLLENEPVTEKHTRVAANFEIHTAGYYAKKETDSVQMIWTRENQKYTKDWDYAFFGSRGMSSMRIANTFPPKNTIHSIDVDGVPILAIVKREDRSTFLAAQARGKNDVAGTLEHARNAVEYDPMNVDAWRMLGMAYVSINQFDQAIDALKNCIKIDSEDFSAYTILGIAYNNKKDYNKGIIALRKAVQLKVNNSSAYQNIGRAYAGKENYNKALAFYEKAVKYDNGTNAQIYFDAAYAMIMQASKNPQIKENRLRNAIQNLDIAIRINPNFIDAYRNISYCYGELGDQQNAQAYLQLMQQRMSGQ